jgi:hypothetical protein
LSADLRLKDKIRVLSCVKCHQSLKNMNISDQGRRIREYEFLLWEYKRNGAMHEVIKKLEDKINKLKQGKFEDEAPQ